MTWLKTCRKCGKVYVSHYLDFNECPSCWVPILESIPKNTGHLQHWGILPSNLTFSMIYDKIIDEISTHLNFFVNSESASLIASLFCEGKSRLFKTLLCSKRIKKFYVQRTVLRGIRRKSDTDSLVVV